MEIGKESSDTDSVSWPQGMLCNDLRRSFELARIALDEQNESIARVTRSLDELVAVLDKAMPMFHGAAQTDLAG